MSDIALVSETELRPEFLLAKEEIHKQGFVLAGPLSFRETMSFLKINSCKQIIINGDQRKLEAFELCQKLKDTFKGTIKVFVYLPNSTVNEGSKFGLINAEVEDESTIINIASKLNAGSKKSYVLDENTTALYSLNGGVGASVISILLGYRLAQAQTRSLLLETSNSFAVKNNLEIETRSSLLGFKREGMAQNKDVDWLSAFVYENPKFANICYLNLFNSIEEKLAYQNKASEYSVKISEDIESLIAKTSPKYDSPLSDSAELLSTAAKSLKLIAKELSGDSFSIFNEVIQLGSKFSSNMFFDLSSDIMSPLNKQLLSFSKSLIVVLRDESNIKNEYLRQKQYLESRYSIRVIPVIAAGGYHASNYARISNDQWQKLLGEVPVIYPYVPEEVIMLFDRPEKLSENSKLIKFADDLLERLSMKVETVMAPQKGLFKFLSNQVN